MSTATTAALGERLRRALRDEPPPARGDLDGWCERVAVAFLASLAPCPYCAGAGEDVGAFGPGDGTGPMTVACGHCAATGFVPKEAGS